MSNGKPLTLSAALWIFSLTVAFAAGGWVITVARSASKEDVREVQVALITEQGTRKMADSLLMEKLSGHQGSTVLHLTALNRKVDVALDRLGIPRSKINEMNRDIDHEVHVK